MKRHRLPRRMLLAVLAAAVVGVAGSVFTAGIPVPITYMSQTSSAITAQDLAPGTCGGMGLTSVVSGNSGTAANDLVLGDAAGATVRGNGGDDCILGGGGDDTVRGDAGNDVCIGGPGTDSFHPTCETQIQ